MHAIVLACYLCLQLSSLSDLSQNVIQKRDVGCDQCVENLFTPQEIVYSFKSQNKTPGETLSSNPVLREIVQDRLTKYESKPESQEKPKEESEYEKQLRLEKFLAAEKQKDDDMRAQYNKMAEEIERELIEKKNQLNEKQTQLNEMNRMLIENQAQLHREIREFEEYAQKRREDAKAPLPTAIGSSFKHILRNGVRLMAGQYLLSENGRYKATMHESCFLVITDEFNDGRTVKQVGSPTHYTSGPECHMIMQGDGNLVTYNKIISPEKGSQVTWHTGTNSWKGAGYYVKLENDGEFVMYDQEHKRVWTHRNGRSRARGYDL